MKHDKYKPKFWEDQKWYFAYQWDRLKKEFKSLINIPLGVVKTTYFSVTFFIILTCVLGIVFLILKKSYYSFICIVIAIILTFYSDKGKGYYKGWARKRWDK